jgi:hypothetical protein
MTKKKLPKINRRCITCNKPDQEHLTQSRKYIDIKGNERVYTYPDPRCKECRKQYIRDWCKRNYKQKDYRLIAY